MAVEIIDPLSVETWDSLVACLAESSYFHTSSWARVITTTYGFTPLYLVEKQNGVLRTLLPLMEAASPITGKRGVMLPFTDFCPIVCNCQDFLRSPLFNQLVAFGRHRRWKYIEFRGGQRFFSEAPAASTFFIHSLDLGRNCDLRRKFRGSTRRNIRKAEASGVEVKLTHTRDAVSQYYRLHCRTRRNHGVPPQPWRFFENLWRHVIDKNKGVVALALHHKQPIAGAVFLHANREVIFKYGASEQCFQHLRPNNLIMWTAMKYFAKAGYRLFSFGRTGTDNSGLLQFKRGWRPSECKLHYYRYDVREQRFLPPGNDYLKTLKPAFQTLPVPILRSIGALVYRHIG